VEKVRSVHTSPNPFFSPSCGDNAGECFGRRACPLLPLVGTTGACYCSAPLARIITCGRLAIEILQSVRSGRDGHVEAVYGPPDAVLLAKKGTSTAFILLALLASQPGCFATKDWLSEKLGHVRDLEGEDEEEAEESEGLKRVDNVVSRLRYLLYPARPNDPPEARLMRHRLVEYQRASGESGPGYRLAGLPLVWLDVVEIDVHIQRARRLEQFGTDSLAEWQAAYDLAMGGRFLPGEAYSDWAECIASN
jgi:hypothetical protein